MTGGALAGVLVALAVRLLAPGRRRRLAQADGSPGSAESASSAQGRTVLERLRLPLCGLAVVAGWTVVGGTAGVLVGLVAGMFSWRTLSSLESPESVRRRRDLERDLPVAVHLLGACLASGASVERALEVVSAAMPGTMGEELGLVLRRLRWGVDPATVWRTMVGPLETLGRSMARAHESGAPVREAVLRLSEDLRADVHLRASMRARTIEVRAAAPLGLCFLPAFVLLGVVPMAAGLFSSLGLFS